MMRSIIFLLVGVLLLLASCRSIKDPVFNGIGNVKLSGLGLTGSVVNLNMKYYNPNKFNARLQNAEGDAWLDSVYLGHFVVDSSIRVPALSDFSIPVKLTMDMKFLLKNSVAALMNKEVTIRIMGKARAGRGGFYKNVPLNYTGRQDLSELLK